MLNAGQEGEGATLGEDGEGAATGEDGNQMNGVNGAEQDQDMANGEDEAVAVGAGLAGERQPNKVRITTPYLTKYERARILGTRALQIRFETRLRLE